MSSAALQALSYLTTSLRWTAEHAIASRAYRAVRRSTSNATVRPETTLPGRARGPLIRALHCDNRLVIDQNRIDEPRGPWRVILS
jgi:hypothetical protein